MEEYKKKPNKKKSTRKPKSRFVGVALKEFKVRGVLYKKDDLYDAIKEGSFKYLINAGYIASKK